MDKNVILSIFRDWNDWKNQNEYGRVPKGLH